MKKIIFLLILIQLAFCLPALAEDSWVLWEKQESIESKSKEMTRDVTWEIIDGYAKEPDCKAARERVVAYEKKHWEESIGGYVKKVTSSSTYVGVETTEGLLQLQYYCLPGTLDPRKGKQ